MQAMWCGQGAATLMLTALRLEDTLPTLPYLAEYMQLHAKSKESRSPSGGGERAVEAPNLSYEH